MGDDIFNSFVLAGTTQIHSACNILFDYVFDINFIYIKKV